ncbi:MAG TPA: RNA polymerase sigma factor [Acidothermaceae bacterium]|nr:RNA polymerase sigma factor [Acidothermaceae bacterium]
MAVDNGETPDAGLWARACAGDHSAFGDLFVRHANRIHNYCFRRTGSWTLAEDATSQTFMEAWRKRSSIVVTDSLLPWLFVAANNVCRNTERARRRAANVHAKTPQSEHVGDHADEVAARIDSERQMQRVLSALRTLKRSDQDVVAMCDWEGLSYDEAAAALGVPIGTVRSRLSRARARLKVLLTDEVGPHADSRVGADELRGEQA